MGLQDRDYASARYDEASPRRFERLGMGGPRRWSVTGWLIAINIAIFIASLLFSRAGVPVRMGDFPAPPVPPGQELRISRELFNRNGSPASDDAKRKVGNLLYAIYVTTDGYAVSDPRLPLVPAPAAEYYVMDPLNAYGHFSTEKGFVYIAGSPAHAEGKLEVWRLITFQFLHGSPAHVLFNMLGLWIFGRIVEEALGRKKYLAFYLSCGIFGGLSYLFLNLAGSIVERMGMHSRIPALLFDDPHTPLIGASAGVFGVIMACAFIRPNEILQLIFPPVTMRMKTLAYGYVLLAAINLFIGGNNAGGDAAHIGGALAGAFFIRHPHLLTDFFDFWSDSRKKQTARPARSGSFTVTQVEEDPEIGRILDKVKAEGLHSLTQYEREKLAAEGSRLKRRA